MEARKVDTRPIIGLWLDWYSREIGVDKKMILIGGKYARAAKELVIHIESAHPENTPVEVLGVVLNNWQRLPDIYRNNCKELHSIKNNWNSLIYHIKNGDSKDQISEYLRSL